MTKELTGKFVRQLPFSIRMHAAQDNVPEMIGIVADLDTAYRYHESQLPKWAKLSRNIWSAYFEEEPTQCQHIVQTMTNQLRLSEQAALVEMIWETQIAPKKSHNWQDFNRHENVFHHFIQQLSETLPSEQQTNEFLTLIGYASGIPERIRTTYSAKAKDTAIWRKISLLNSQRMRLRGERFINMMRHDVDNNFLVVGEKVAAVAQFLRKDIVVQQSTDDLNCSVEQLEEFYSSQLDNRIKILPAGYSRIGKFIEKNNINYVIGLEISIRDMNHIVHALEEMQFQGTVMFSVLDPNPEDDHHKSHLITKKRKKAEIKLSDDPVEWGYMIIFGRN